MSALGGAVIEECDEPIEDDPLRDEKLNKEGHYAEPETEQYYQEIDESNAKEELDRLDALYRTETKKGTKIEASLTEEQQKVYDRSVKQGMFKMDDDTLGTKDQQEVIDDYPMASWEAKLKAPYIERWNGNLCVKADRITDAIKYYNKALFGLKMIFDGNKERFMNNPHEALEFVRDIEIPVSLNLAHCYNKKGDYHYAIKYCGDVLKSDEQNVKALYRRGVAYTNIGEVQKAKTDLLLGLEVCAKDSPDRSALVKQYQALQALVERNKLKAKGMGENFFKFPDKRPELDKIEKEREERKAQEAENEKKAKEKAANYVKEYKLSLADEYNGGSNAIFNPFETGAMGTSIADCPDINSVIAEEKKQEQKAKKKEKVQKNPYDERENTATNPRKDQDEEWSLVSVIMNWILFFVLWPWHLFVWVMRTQYNFICWCLSIPMKLFSIKVQLKKKD